MPLNGRNIVQLAVLVPGVQFGQRSGMNRGDGGYIPEGSYSVSANGVRELHQVVTLDGTDTADVRRSVTPFVPSIEAIEEFKLQTSSFSAEVGFGGGAVTNITLKSGTNEFARDALPFPAQQRLRRGALLPELREVSRRAPGGQPAYPQHLRFRCERTDHQEQDVLDVRLGSAPGANQECVGRILFLTIRSGGETSRNCLPGSIRTGGRLRAPIVIYDPFTGEPFPNNVIPSSRIHPGIRDNILPVVSRADFRQPDPLDFTKRQGIVRPLKVDQYFTKVDHHFSDKDRIFGRLAVSIVNDDRPTLNENFETFREADVYNVATQWIHTFSQNMINEFRFGFQRFSRGSRSPRTGDDSFNMPGSWHRAVPHRGGLGAPA